MFIKLGIPQTSFEKMQSIKRSQWINTNHIDTISFHDGKVQLSFLGSNESVDYYGEITEEKFIELVQDNKSMFYDAFETI
jgi:hypothetical protein